MTHSNPVEQHFIDFQWHLLSVPRVIRQTSGGKSKENQYSERLDHVILALACGLSILVRNRLPCNAEK